MTAFDIPFLIFVGAIVLLLLALIYAYDTKTQYVLPPYHDTRSREEIQAWNEKVQLDIDARDVFHSHLEYFKNFRIYGEPYRLCIFLNESKKKVAVRIFFRNTSYSVLTSDGNHFSYAYTLEDRIKELDKVMALDGIKKLYAITIDKVNKPLCAIVEVGNGNK